MVDFNPIGLLKQGGDLLKQGNDAAKRAEELKKQADKAGITGGDKKPDGSPAAANEGLTVKIGGKASAEAQAVEAYMKANDLPVNPNGVLSEAEAKTLKGSIDKKPSLKGQVTFGPEEVHFSPKALDALGIENPKAPAKAAPQAAAAPATASEPNAADRAGTAVKDGANAVKEGAMSAWDKAKAAFKEANKCNDSDNPAYTSQTCIDVRAKQPGRDNNR